MNKRPEAHPSSFPTFPNSCKFSIRCSFGLAIWRFGLARCTWNVATARRVTLRQTMNPNPPNTPALPSGAHRPESDADGDHYYSQDDDDSAGDVVAGHGEPSRKRRRPMSVSYVLFLLMSRLPLNDDGNNCLDLDFSSLPLPLPLCEGGEERRSTPLSAEPTQDFWLTLRRRCELCKQRKVCTPKLKENFRELSLKSDSSPELICRRQASCYATYSIASRLVER